jgi:signal transduction histidine kinase
MDVKEGHPLPVSGKVIRFRDWPVRRKLLALLVTASLAPIGVVTALDVGAARGALRDATGATLAARADQLRGELDAFHRGYLRTISAIARVPTVLATCEASGERIAGERAVVRGLLDAYVASDRALYAAGVLDRTGRVVTATSAAMVGKAWGSRDGVRAALRGATTISEVGVADPASSELTTVEYVAPVLGRAGPVGAVVIWVRAEAVWALPRQHHERAGPGSFAVVVDPYGILLAQTSRPDAVFQPTGPLALREVEVMLGDQRFGPGTQGLLARVTPFPELYERARAADPDRSMFRGFAAASSQWTLAVARRLTEVPWTVFYLVPERELEAQIAAMTRRRLALAGILMAGALALGLTLARAIRRPVVALSAAASSIATGDLSARAPVGGDDELGQLCASFNAMAARIERDDAAQRLSRDQLEHRVAERTAALAEISDIEAQARVALEASAARLEVLARTVHELAAASGDADAVLELAAHRLGEVIGESAAILLLSDDGQWLEPTRSVDDRDPARREIANALHGATRQPARDGPTGWVLASGEALLIPHVDGSQHTAIAGAAPGATDQLGVASLLILPLRSRERTIGVVNLVRSARSLPYTLDDQRFAQEVADRAGLAIDNAVLVATLERRVAARTAALEVANQELDAFGESVSHDLRAPLRAIEGFSHVLLTEHGDQLDDNGKHYLHRVRSATQRMFSLIEDLLSLARLTRLELRWASVDMSALAGHVAADLRRRDPERTTPIHVAPELSARGDGRLLAIVLDNLLGNAWKFTANHQGAAIWFGCESRDGQDVFYVRDSGAGFDMRYVHKLFLPFQRLHQSSEYEGVGIGLATVRRIIARHGGRIWGEGLPGEGATFSFTLNVAPGASGEPVSHWSGAIGAPSRDAARGRQS